MRSPGESSGLPGSQMLSIDEMFDVLYVCEEQIVRRSIQPYYTD